ncbi:AlpA family phage regulatory protein [Vibrio parahaemolyticus]|nr:AlpA family phage regulatory protein [Vibrio parahaemolyticus]EJC7056102.1 AlpA family phage regulatory protein [Vibrio parahaemolyticus]EJC7099512.1 AlpA family phage regulatory protein [Vibrio parahaemolyticus]EJC7113262.1 AlpA family phage regulatory protein [Vibrio parahaemolyticus]EJC7132289.1 AlpA family phage regulatory protein [Vibrio parahaemolyticus]
MKTKFMKFAELISVLGVSKATVYRWIKVGELMHPIELGPNTKIFLREEVEFYLDGIVAGKNKQELVEEVYKRRNCTPMV